MSGSSKTLLPIGFEDFTAPRAENAHQMLVKIVACFSNFDYALVEPPLLEYENALLSVSEGLEAHDIFRLIDPISHQTLGLRGDITVQIVRLVRDHLRQAPRPLRLAYYGHVLRIKNTPLRPQRQYMQLGLEQIGGTSHAEIEVLQVALEALTQVGVSGICLDFALPTLLRRYQDRLSGDVQEMLQERNIGNVRLAKQSQRLDPVLAEILEFLLLLPPEPFRALEQLEKHPEFASDHALFAQLRRILTHIQQSHPDIQLSLDTIEQNGFAYKTGVAYTLLARGQNTSLGRGGAYAASGENACGVSLNLHNLLLGQMQKTAQKKIYIPHSTDFETIRTLCNDGWVIVFHPTPEKTRETLTSGAQSYFKDGQIYPITHLNSGSSKI